MGKHSSNLFSYGWVTEVTRPDYDAMLLADGVAFYTWRAGRPSLSLAGHFKAWWNTKGPTAFATPDDAFRYKRELWAAVESAAAIQQPPETSSES
jgi:hypothetical protein